MLFFTLVFAAPPSLQDGDLVFHRSRSTQSEAIAMATGSRWTHVGLVRRKGEEVWVLEAVHPVKLTPWDQFVARGEGPTVVRRPGDGVWSEGASTRLDVLQAAWLGRPYDVRFEPGMDRLYCSELVREAYLHAANRELAPLRPLGSYEVADPALRRAITGRWGAVPEELLVVAPSDLYDAPGMSTVWTGSAPGTR